MDILKVGEKEILRRGRLLQASPELRHRLLKAYVETGETYEESPWLEGQIYRGFPNRSDEALMREFQGASWLRRVDISDQLADDRFRKIAKRIIFNERPEVLDDGTRKAFSKGVAQRWLSSEKVPWLTIEAALSEIEERREAAPFDEAVLLDSLEAFYRRRESGLRITSDRVAKFCFDGLFDARIAASWRIITFAMFTGWRADHSGRPMRSPASSCPDTRLQKGVIVTVVVLGRDKGRWSKLTAPSVALAPQRRRQVVYEDPPPRAVNDECLCRWAPGTRGLRQLQDVRPVRRW